MKLFINVKSFTHVISLFLVPLSGRFPWAILACVRLLCYKTWMGTLGRESFGIEASVMMPFGFSLVYMYMTSFV